ncbi:MAG TPA: hypothetical protein VFN97_24640 [Actinospica sp.]|nr:hypothetical protein [Actinospica sp.]
MQKSEEERLLHAGYQALADYERWAALGARAPEFADRLAAAGSAAAAHRRIAQGTEPQAPDALLDEAEQRVRPADWWEALAKAYHWQLLSAQACGVEIDPEPQRWAEERLAGASADPGIADRLALVERRLAGEALVLRHALGAL